MGAVYTLLSLRISRAMCRFPIVHCLALSIHAISLCPSFFFLSTSHLIDVETTPWFRLFQCDAGARTQNQQSEAKGFDPGTRTKQSEAKRHTVWIRTENQQSESKGFVSGTRTNLVQQLITKNSTYVWTKTIYFYC